MFDYTFRNITSEELEEAYKLHERVVEKLLSKNIKQWLKPIDKNKLLERQSKNENFGLFSKDKELLVFLSLVRRDQYFEWEKFISEKDTIWLNTVSVNVNHTNKKLGEIAIRKAINFCQQKRVDVIYLDCVLNDGYLKRYYENLGFKVIGQQTNVYRSGTYEMVLMKYNILK